MKYLYATILSATVFLLTSGSAFSAEYFTPGFYSVGGGNVVIPTNGGTALGGGETSVGWRLNRFYAIEANYTDVYGNASLSGFDVNERIERIGLDALGFLPFGRGSRIALFSDVGIGSYIFSASVLGATASSTYFGEGVGGGIQYQFSKSIGIRATVKYDWINSSVGTTGGVEAGVGLVFKFD